MDKLTMLALSINPLCVRLWKGDAVSPVADVEDRPHYDADCNETIITVKDTIILTEERCDRLYSKWAASDYMGSFYQYAYADMIENMLPHQSRMVRATNHINSKIGKADIPHLLTDEF